jgi:hypothetical protein
LTDIPIIVPLVLSRPGAFKGIGSSGMAERETLDVLAQSAKYWNSRPVQMSHDKDAHPIGTLRNCRIENNSLVGDAHIFPQQADRAGAAHLLTTLRAGKRIGASIFVTAQDDGTPGMTPDGISYRATWTSIKPMHVALTSNPRECADPLCGGALRQPITKDNIMTHDRNCSGCPQCNTEMAALPKMTAAQYAHWCTLNSAETMTALGMRTAAHQPDTSAVFRAATKQRGLPLKESDIQATHDHAHEMHAQSIALGATCPDDADISDDDDADISTHTTDDDDQARADNSRNRVMRAASAQVRRRGYGSVVRSTPDGYRAATAKAQEVKDAISADVFPGYKPHGTPPDPYKIGLAMRTLAHNPDAVAPAAIIRTNNIPDPYKTALARRSA